VSTGKKWPSVSQEERGLSSLTSERANSSHTLISDFQPPALWENKFLWFLATWPVILCYGGPSKLTQKVKWGLKMGPCPIPTPQLHGTGPKLSAPPRTLHFSWGIQHCEAPAKVLVTPLLVGFPLPNWSLEVLACPLVFGMPLLHTSLNSGLYFWLFITLFSWAL
jgi:hypothetical protein